jgi:hypothetical protein
MKNFKTYEDHHDKKEDIIIVVVDSDMMGLQKYVSHLLCTRSSNIATLVPGSTRYQLNEGTDFEMTDGMGMPISFVVVSWA